MCVGDYSKLGIDREAVTLKLIILFIENPISYQDVKTGFFLTAVIIRTDTSIIFLRNFI
jgi:hypothetical protein